MKINLKVIGLKPGDPVSIYAEGMLGTRFLFHDHASADCEVLVVIKYWRWKNVWLRVAQHDPHLIPFHALDGKVIVKKG